MQWPVALMMLVLCLAPSTQAAANSPAQRVVTLAPNLAELVCAAGGCDRLVGVTAYTDYPPQAAQVQRIGDAFALDFEAVLAARPDLVLAWASGTPPSNIAKLRRLGLRVEVPRVDTLDDIATALRTLGGWLGTRKIADHAAAAYRRRLAKLRARYRRAGALRVFYQIGTNPAYTVNRDSLLSSALAVCGGENVFADLPRIASPVSAEAVLAARPQVVLYGRDENRAAIHAYWSRLPGVPAERNGNLFMVDTGILSGAAPRILDGIAHVCRIFDRVRKKTDD